MARSRISRLNPTPEEQYRGRQAVPSYGHDRSQPFPTRIRHTGSKGNPETFQEAPRQNLHYYRHFPPPPLTNSYSVAPYAHQPTRPRHTPSLPPTSANYRPEYKDVNDAPGGRDHYPRHREQQGRKACCYNCGEFNHQQLNCRFDHKVKCGSCQRLGHKSKLCASYSA
ncbi:hypothetical protein GWK47_045671 [Chionoecetes opilio]|uniref:CCHC-type domain-containing protein n=1 Tax=Chionoecetes opilio TaxID=41210 RepID=A0A8J5CWR0_CHIOP|nr:hypothetical protein GWK47_045671 [Chionoecetes opilio]